MYTLTKLSGNGHAFVAFGDYSSPSLVFNWGGALGGSAPFAGAAMLSRVPWSDARRYFIIPGDKYHVHTIINGRADEAYNYADSRFNEATPIRGQNESRVRSVNYQLFWGNCSTFCYDVTARALRVLHTVVVGQIIDTPAAFYGSLETCRAFDGAVKRSFIIEATGTKENPVHTVTAWR